MADFVVRLLISCSFCIFISLPKMPETSARMILYMFLSTVIALNMMLPSVCAVMESNSGMGLPIYRLLNDEHLDQDVKIIRFRRYSGNQTSVSSSDTASISDNLDIPLFSTDMPSIRSSVNFSIPSQTTLPTNLLPRSSTLSAVSDDHGASEDKVEKGTNNKIGHDHSSWGRELLNETSDYNVTLVEDEEDHNYYSSRIILASDSECDSYWLDESVMQNTHQTLSASYRSAATIRLKFPFLFYGHEIKQVTIATGGFLYMSDFLHQWLTATQYIAPLMANFDTQLGNDSHIRYFDNGTVFVVWWKDIFLQDYTDAGLFSFQTMLHKDGCIIFSYKQIPLLNQLKISTLRHPVKVGVSDAYYVDRPTNADMRQRTIYEYHRVEINMSRISSHTAVVITPLRTCVSLKACAECTNSSSLLESRFQCQWCPALRRCSDGLDRMRQEWLDKSCDKKAADTYEVCQLLGDGSSEALTDGLWGVHDRVSGVGVVGCLFIIVFVILIVFGVLWLWYAYRYPNSPSGLWLIRHRPEGLLKLLRRARERIRRVRGGGRGCEGDGDKYQVAMTPEAEEILT